MARSYANIFCSIWDDPEFCALPSDAQRTYFMLVTQKDISACGSLPLTIRRWSRTLPDADRATLEPALQVLSQHKFILIDEDTEELLVRTFPKHDGGYKHGKRVLAVIAYAEAIRSQSLRTTAAVELDKLGVRTAILLPPDSESVANEEAIDSRRSVVTLVELDPQTTNHKPQTTNLDPAAKPQRATRINDWAPTATEIEWARAQGFADEFSRYETTKFGDYWRAKSGRDATKTDWPATWRNWLRRAAEQAGTSRASPSGTSPATAKAQGWLDLGTNPARQEITTGGTP